MKKRPSVKQLSSLAVRTAYLLLPKHSSFIRYIMFSEVI